MKLFGTSGIRGVVGKEITGDFLERLGRTIAVYQNEAKDICVAYDTRPSNEYVRDSLVAGLTENGCNVTDLGILTTPGLAYLTRELEFDTGIMITASHNPPAYNGIKIFDKTGMGYSREAEREIERLFGNPIRQSRRKGEIRKSDGASIYIGGLLQHLTSPKKYRIVVDCSCGSASLIAPYLLRQLGHEVFEINCFPDITRCTRDLETGPESLEEAIQELKYRRADIVACFDGDADRIIFADEHGFIGYNEAIAYVAGLKLKENSNRKVVTTIETGRVLDDVVKVFGGSVIRTRVGDVPVAYETKHRNACLGVEQIGVYIHPEFGFFPASLYNLAFLLDSISTVSEIRDEMAKQPKYYSGRIKIDCQNHKKAETMQKIAARLDELKYDSINDLDGFRLECQDSWILIRPSGTEPVIRVLGESSDYEKLETLFDRSRKLVEVCLE